MLKILIVDDNKQITSILEEYAKKEGYIPMVAYDGEQAIAKTKDQNPDIILLDVMMPNKDGFAVCREIRSFSNVPIIMVTARGEDFERIMGLEIGADDYIVKPFSPGEVIARIKAIMRRLNKDEVSSRSITFDDLKIDLEKYIVTIDTIEVSLTKKEIEILYTLANSKNKVFTRENLLNSVWGYEYYGDNRTVDSHIKRLRAKLDGYNHPTWNIKTIRGIGYKFEVEENV